MYNKTKTMFFTNRNCTVNSNPLVFFNTLRQPVPGVTLTFLTANIWQYYISLKKCRIVHLKLYQNSRNFLKTEYKVNQKGVKYRHEKTRDLTTQGRGNYYAKCRKLWKSHALFCVHRNQFIKILAFFWDRNCGNCWI